jgi:autotransporter-associated beta strand protein
MTTQRPLASLLAGALLAAALPALAAEFTKANNTDNLNLGSSWTNGVAPGTSDVGVWDSTVTGPNAVALGADLAWAGIRVTNVGGAITLSAGNTLTLGTTGINMSGASQGLTLNCGVGLSGSQTWNVAAGQTLAVVGTVAKGANNLTLTNGGTVSLSGAPTGTGGLYLDGGTLLSYGATGGTTSDFRIGNNVGGTPGFVMTGGDLTVLNQIYFSYGGASSGSFTQSGGTLTMNGIRGANSNTGGTPAATILLNGGTLNSLTDAFMLTQRGNTTLTISNTANATISQITMTGWAGSGSSTVNLDGGSLTTDGFWETTVSGLTPAANGSYTTTVNFNGTLVTARTANQAANFLNFVDNANVSEGGAKINTASLNITIAKGLAHGGVAPTDGGLTKIGPGALTLSGANTYTGATTVSNGTLYVNGSLNAGSTVAVTPTAVLGGSGSASTVTVAAGGGIEGGSGGAGTLTVGTLTYSGSGTLKVTAALQPYVPVAVTSALNLGGTVAINLGNTASLSSGTYHLLSSVTPFSGAGTFTAPAVRGSSLQTNFDGTTYYLDLVVNALTGDDIWTGAVNSSWDTGITTNWTFTGDSTPSAFYVSDSVIFNDTTQSNTVNVSVADVSPSTVTFNNDVQAYSVRGTKAIKAAGAVTFNGAAAVSISNALSSSSSSLAINGAGAVTLNNTNSFPAGSLTVASGAGTVTLNGPTTTSGAATVSGGTLNLNAATLTSGNTLVNGGTLAVGTGGSFRNGTGTLTVSGPSGATLHLAGGAITNQTGNFTVAANANESGTLTIDNGTMTISSGAFNLGNASGTAANFNLNGGTFNQTSGTLTLGSVAGATATFNQTGGTFNYTSGNNFILDNNPASATVNLSGGIFNSTGPLQLTQRGTGVVNVASSANVNAGYAALVGWTTAGSRGTINLNGGSLTVRKVQKTVDGQSAQGTATFNFNGGLLRASTNGLFMAGLSSANVLDGGAFIDDGGFSITNSQALLTGGTGIGGLTKSGAGTLLLSGANTYGGPTKVTAGTLALSGSLSGAGGISVTNGTFATTANIPAAGPLSVANGSLTVGANNSVTGPALTLGTASANTETINTVLGASTAYVPLAATNSNGLTVNSGISNVTLNITGTMSGVGNYHLIQHNGPIQGTGFSAFKLGTTPNIGSYPRSVSMSLSNNPGFVDLSIVGEAIYWTGLNSADFSGANNWKLANSTPTSFLTGDVVIFDNSTSVQAVNLNSNVSPTSITFNNDASHNYTLGSATGNAIIGGQLIKDGVGSLTLNNSNSFAGGSTLLNGTLLVGNSSALGTGALALTGGALQAAGGPQTLANLISLTGNSTANGANVLTLGGSITGSGTLAVASPATVVLTGTNTAATGTLNISSGLVQVTQPASLPTGNLTVGSSGHLDVNPGTALTVSAATVVAGSGLVTLDGPAPTGNNAIDVHIANPAASLAGFSGNVVISNNVRLIPDAAIYSPLVTAEVQDGSQLFLGDTLGTINGLGLIKIAGRGSSPAGGTGPLGALRVEQVIATGIGSTYAGPIQLTTNAAIGNAANGRASIISGNISGAYELEIIPRYNFTANATIVRLSGTNSYGSTRVDGGNFAPYNSAPAQLIADSATALSSGAMSLDGGVLDVNGFSFTFANLNSTTNGGTVKNNNTNLLSSCTISVGTDNASTLFSGDIVDGTTGILGLTKVGTGTLTLSGNDTYSGATTVSNGTLLVLNQINSSSGGVTVGTNGALAGIGFITGAVSVDGRLVPGTNAAPFGTLSIPALTLNAASKTIMTMDRASGTFAQVTGFGTVNFGGTLILTNLGGAFANGDSFTLFQASSYNGTFVNVQFFPAVPGPGLAWDTTQLASAGIVSVVTSSVNTTPPHLTNSVSGGNLTLSWPADHLGWRLEAQSNAHSIGLSNNWVTVPGSTNVTSMTFPVNPANPTEFYRLVYP